MKNIDYMMEDLKHQNIKNYNSAQAHPSVK